MRTKARPGFHLFLATATISALKSSEARESQPANVEVGDISPKCILELITDSDGATNQVMMGEGGRHRPIYPPGSLGGVHLDPGAG